MPSRARLPPGLLPPGLALGLALSLGGAATLVACGPREPLPPDLAYARLCARCHGFEGEGDPDQLAKGQDVALLRSPMLITARATGDSAAVRERIAEGHGPMPAFEGKLTDAEIRALAIWTIDRMAPIAPIAPEAPGPPDAASGPEPAPNDATATTATVEETP